MACKLVNKISDSPSWFQHVLEQIRNKSLNLHQVVKNNKTNFERLPLLSNQELKNLYLIMYHSTLDLYQYARVPEILDRGVAYYSNYLVKYLQKVLHKENVYDEFALLTISNVESIYRLADKEKMELRKMAVLENLDKTSVRDFYLHASYKLRNEIKNYCERWKYMFYHGYGDKKVLTENDIIHDILKGISLSDARIEQDNYQIINKVSPKFKILFDFYPLIANAKLYRKYYQIELFFYLDKLLEEIADRMKQPMCVIRSMLPEELLFFLDEKEVDIDTIKKRIPECIYYDDGIEHIIVDNHLLSEAKITLRKHRGENEKGKYHGFPVSKGKLTGKCIYYQRNGGCHRFDKKDIVLCEAVDPDMFDDILGAGAVLSVQGGVTSHAAIFCRENHIPSIGGIVNLFDIKEGSWLYVDAFRGNIYVGDATNYHPLGTKAKNLDWLKHNGFNVPDFFVENYSSIKQKVDNIKSFEAWVNETFFLKLYQMKIYSL